MESPREMEMISAECSVKPKVYRASAKGRLTYKEAKYMYNHSNEGKADRKRYSQTPKGKAVNVASAKKYNASAQGAKKMKKYRASEAYRLSARKCHYKSTYNITLEQYEEMVRKRNGLCDICHKQDLKHRLVVDHDHVTGENRGLLCRTCNTGIGYLRDDIELLESALKYLKKYSSTNLSRQVGR